MIDQRVGKTIGRDRLARLSASAKCSFDRMVSEPNTTSMSCSRSESRSKSSMLLEKVIALRVVKPANRSSHPAFSQPASSARKTVSGFPAASRLVSANRSSGMTHPPHQTNSQPSATNGGEETPGRPALRAVPGGGGAGIYAIRSKVTLEMPKVSESHARLSDIIGGRPNTTSVDSATPS